MRPSFDSLWTETRVATQPQPGHLCVAGQISDDWTVVQRLKRRHQVTLVENPSDLVQSTVLSTVSVLALDCGTAPESGLMTLSLVSRLYPQLLVVLVNGRLSQGEIVEAYRRGACDYLSQQVEPDLTIERIESLCSRATPYEEGLTQ